MLEMRIQDLKEFIEDPVVFVQETDFRCILLEIIDHDGNRTKIIWIQKLDSNTIFQDDHDLYYHAKQELRDRGFKTINYGGAGISFHWITKSICICGCSTLGNLEPNLAIPILEKKFPGFKIKAELYEDQFYREQKRVYYGKELYK